MSDISTGLPELMLQKFHNVESWMERAQCAIESEDGWDPMYEPEGDEIVEKLCSRCSVVRECREYAESILENQPESSNRALQGVYGGEHHLPRGRGRK